MESHTPRIKRVIAAGAMIIALVALSLSSVPSAFASGTVGTAAGFEDDDGNLVVDSTFDWNGFAPVSWQPSPSTTPTRQVAKTVSGWQFAGFEDWQATGSDNGFAGGTKQDADCATVITQKADNKADLKRIYLASKTVGGHTYLMLAWVRIPQNTTSPSAHVAFEFNKATSGACPTSSNSDGLVKRTAGDLLILYDFEGGSTSTPTIGMEKWVTGTTDTCEISSDSPPCWGTEVTLASGTAEAAVDTGVNGFPGSVTDALTPPALTSDTGTSATETLGTNEFGEAGIDLTNAGVFTAGTCETFGQAHGVTRTSGNAGTAQMKDLVGPGAFSLTNCGSLKITKTGKDKNCTDAGTPTITNGVCTGAGTANLKGATFTIKDSSGTEITGSPATTGDDGTTCVDNLPFGTYSVKETSAPSGYDLDSTAAQSASITTAGACGSGDEATVSFSDTPRTDLTVSSSAESAGATNSTISCTDVDGNVVASSGSTPTDPATASKDGLPPGTYTCTIVIDP